MTDLLWLGPDGAPVDRPGYPLPERVASAEEPAEGWRALGFCAMTLERSFDSPTLPTWYVGFEPHADRFEVSDDEEAFSASCGVDMRFPVKAIEARTPQGALQEYAKYTGPANPYPTRLTVTQNGNRAEYVGDGPFLKYKPAE